MSTSPESLDLPHVPKKRQRIVIDKWAALGACDSCRSRRVKCIRLDQDSRDCEACKARDELCQNLRNGGMKYKKRESKKNQPAAAITPHAPQQIVPLSQTSTEAGLQRMELSETLMAELLASFFKHSNEQAPYADFAKIQVDFDLAGRRLSQLPLLDQAVILAMIASSAQFSDSQLLLGSNAPRLNQLTSVQNDVSLGEYGHRRQALCEQLLRDVVDLTDSRGLFRKASPQSISVLMMLPRLLRHPMPLKWKSLDKLGDTWRPFVTAALGHVRTLYETQGVEHVDLGGIQWPMVIGDACHSAFTGYNLMVTEEDLLDFPHMSGLPPPSSSIARTYIMSKDSKEFPFPVIAIWNEVITVTRQIAKTVSIPLFKKRHVELATFSQRVQDVRRCLATLRVCEQVATELEPLIDPAVLEYQKQTLGASVSTYLKFAPVTPALLMPVLHKQFEQYKQQYAPIISLDENHLLEDLHKIEIQQQIQIGLIEAMSIVADTIRSLEGKDLVASLTRQTSLLVPIQDSIILYTHLAFDIPTFEQHGPSAEWTEAVKLDTLKLFIEAARLQAWAWSDREADVAVCDFRLKQYQESLHGHPPPLSLDVASLSGQEIPIMPSSTSSTSTADPATDLNFILGIDSNMSAHLGESTWGMDTVDPWGTLSTEQSAVLPDLLLDPMQYLSNQAG